MLYKSLLSLTLIATVAARADVIYNEGFELGTAYTTTTPVYSSSGSSLYGWNQWANSSPSVSTQQSTDHVIEGNYSAYISGNTNDGLYQYNFLGANTYTASGWFYVQSGSAHILLVSNGSGQAITFSQTTTTLGQWEYLSVTNYLQDAYVGPTIYTASDNSSFWVDGFWMNAGGTSTSPWDPSTGFNPNTAAVPEPGSLALMAMGMGSLALIIRRKREYPIKAGTGFSGVRHRGEGDIRNRRR